MNPIDETHVSLPSLVVVVVDVAAADDTSPAFQQLLAADRWATVTAKRTTRTSAMRRIHRRRPAGPQRDCRPPPAGTFRGADGVATPRMLPQTDSRGSSFSRVSRPSRPVQRRCPGRTARCRGWSRLNRPAPEIA
ncbi:DUF6207 family protein [Streptomyces sp. NBC_00659]